MPPGSSAEVVFKEADGAFVGEQLPKLAHQVDVLHKGSYILPPYLVTDAAADARDTIVMVLAAIYPNGLQEQVH